MKQAKETVIRNIDEFEQDIHLWNILSGGSGKGLVLLRKIVDSYFWAENNKLPKILITGKQGKLIHARALINSLCIEDMKECDAKYFDSGISSKLFMLEDAWDSARLITNIDNLRSPAESVLWRYLKFGSCSYYNPVTRQSEVVHSNGAIVLTAQKIELIANPIIDACDYVIELEPYSQEQLELIVLQRIRYCGFNYENELVLKRIVRVGNGEIKQIMRLLRICITLAQADLRGEIRVNDIDKAEKLI